MWNVPRSLLVASLVLAACAGAPATAPSRGGSPPPDATSAGLATPTLRATSAPTAARTPAPTISLPDVTDLATTTALAISAKESPDFITLADGYAFVSGVGLGIGRFDASGALMESFQIPGGTCEALDAGFGAAWSATCGGPGLVRIDSATGAGTVSRIDPASNAVVAEISLGEPVRAATSPSAAGSSGCAAARPCSSGSTRGRTRSWLATVRTPAAGASQPTRPRSGSRPTMSRRSGVSPWTGSWSRRDQRRPGVPPAAPGEPGTPVSAPPIAASALAGCLGGAIS